MPIPKATATKAALERVVLVLPQKLQDELDDLREAGEVELTAPTVDHYYLPGRWRDDVIYTAPVACVVEQRDRDRTQHDESSDGESTFGTCDLPVRILLSFAMDAYEPESVTGRPQIQSEAMSDAAHRYGGAIVQTICRWLETASGVCDLVHIDGTNPGVANKLGGMRGIVEVDLILKQSVSFPANIRVSSPADAI